MPPIELDGIARQESSHDSGDRRKISTHQKVHMVGYHRPCKTIGMRLNQHPAEPVYKGVTIYIPPQAVKMTKSAGLPVCVHIILGLPGETKKDMLETARLLAGLGIEGLKIHLRYVLKGSGMEMLFKIGQYNPLTQQEYVDLVCDVLELIPPDVVIQRLTGDPRPEELVAPLWARDKMGMINAIKTALKERGSFQGKYFA